MHLTFTKKSADIMCFLCISYFINTAYKVMWCSIFIINNLATTVNPYRHLILIKPSVTNIVILFFSFDNALIMLCKQRPVIFIHKPKTTIQCVTKWIILHHKTLYCWLWNVTCILLQIYNIKVIIHTWRK